MSLVLPAVGWPCSEKTLNRRDADGSQLPRVCLQRGRPRWPLVGCRHCASGSLFGPFPLRFLAPLAVHEFRIAVRAGERCSAGRFVPLRVEGLPGEGLGGTARRTRGAPAPPGRAGPTRFPGPSRGGGGSGVSRGAPCSRAMRSHRINVPYPVRIRRTGSPSTTSDASPRRVLGQKLFYGLLRRRLVLGLFPVFDEPGIRCQRCDLS